MQPIVPSKNVHFTPQQRTPTAGLESSNAIEPDNDDLFLQEKSWISGLLSSEFSALPQPLSEVGGHSLVHFAGDPPARRYSDSGPTPPALEHIVRKRPQSSDGVVRGFRDTNSL